MTQRKIFLFSKHDFHLRFASIRKFRFKIINHDFEKEKKKIGSCLVVKTIFLGPGFPISSVFWFVKQFLSYICILAARNATMSTMCTMSSTYSIVNWEIWNICCPMLTGLIVLGDAIAYKRMTCCTLIIGPESDHWLCLSLTDSLTD